MDLREPKEITIISLRGKEHKFILSSFPAWDGSLVMERIPSGFMTIAIPKLSDWDGLEYLKLLIMKYVAVDNNGQHLRLSTKELIDNHVPDGQALMQLLRAEVGYNQDFFTSATLSSFLEEACRVAFQKISEILTQSSAQSLPTEKPASTN